MADIAAAIFGTIAAIETVIKLFQKWRKHREKKKSQESEKLAEALSQAPQQIRDKCDACLKGPAGYKLLELADASALRTIERTVEHFTRTMKEMFRIAMLGRTLKFDAAQETLHHLITSIVVTVDSLNHGRPPQQEDLSKALVLRNPSRTSVATKRSYTIACMQSSALRSIASSRSDFRADMQRIEGERSASKAMDAFQAELSALARDRDKPRNLEAPVPVMALPSWGVLRGIQSNLQSSKPFV